MTVLSTRKSLDRTRPITEVELSAACLENALRPLLNSDTLLVTDGCTSYPPCAAARGITHEAINLSAGERVRGEIHIQTANSRHERLKSFLRNHRGVATRYLDSYLRWYKLTILPKTAYDERHRQRVLSNLQRRAKILGFTLAPIPEPVAVS